MKHKNSDAEYTLPNGVMKNKYGITDDKILSKKEGFVTLMKSLDKDFINRIQSKDPFDPKTLKWIHKELFGDVYEWAGEYRTVNISKGHNPFLPHDRLNTREKDIYSSKPNNFPELIKMYVVLNHMHPFREGNGRTTRIWLNLATDKVLEKQINFFEVPTEKYMDVMMADNIDKVIELFEDQLISTKDLSLEIHEMILVQSWRYEGYLIGRRVDQEMETISEGGYEIYE